MPSPRLLTFIDTSPLVHSTLHSIWLTQGPPLASQIFSCPESTSGMAAGGAFPELSPGFSRSWLSPLQPLLQVPTLPASWLSQAHPLIPTSEPPPEDTGVAPAPLPLPTAPPQAWLLLSFTHGTELLLMSHIHPHVSRMSPHLNHARARRARNLNKP